jgi:hypothetical protein
MFIAEPVHGLVEEHLWEIVLINNLPNLEYSITYIINHFGRKNINEMG